MEMPPQEVPCESVEELFENAPCGYLTTTSDGTIWRMNRTLLGWLGYAREDLLGKRRLVDLLTTPGKVFHETHYAPLLYMQGWAHEIALDFVRRDGSRLPALLSSTLVRKDSGEPWYVRTSVFNATDRRKYERELLLERREAEQAAKVKAELLAMASHEIRNQLHAITAVTQLFLAEPSASDHDRYLGLLEASSGSLLALVNDILDYAKLEAGKLALDERPFSVGDVVRGMTASLQARAELVGLSLLVDIDPRVPPLVEGDAIKISQVLTNLCGNALKFTKGGSIRIAVRVREHGPEAVTLAFSVSDTGRGIPAHQLASISDAFTHTSTDTSARERSSGLGLSICQRLLALHGSSLNVESQVGKGSTFSFELRLPIVQSREARQLLGDIMARHTLRGIRVLIAMQDEAQKAGDALQLTRLLERWGADFELVDSGERVLDRVKRARYDLVLMDLELASGEGGRFTRVIRDLPSEDPATLPIIALGWQVEPGQRERLAGAGFTDFLCQPFESDHLFRSIALHASIHRALRNESDRKTIRRARPS
jgi:PAS domain S-box-containing protein